MKGRHLVALISLLLCFSVWSGLLFAGGAQEAEQAETSMQAAEGVAMESGGDYDWAGSWFAPPTASQLGITSFNEAPELKSLVAQGSLPSVGERLPDDPVVLQPLREVGKYGGTLRVARMGPSDWGDLHRGTKGLLFRADPSASGVVPYLGKGYEISSDNKTLTIYLREGVKWSDGAPFTSEDFTWNWENRVHDPNVAAWDGGFNAGGKSADVVALDDYTVKMTFAEPVPSLRMTRLLNWYSVKSPDLWSPAHFAKQYHIDFNPDAGKEAKAEGYENWQGYLNAKLDMGPSQAYPHPELGPWYMESISAQKKLQLRNPYFWAVDTEGNQLPYIDRVEAVYFSDKEVAVLSMMQGKIDIGGRLMNPADFPVYKENEGIGNYTLYEWQDTKMTRAGYQFNMTHNDPVLRKIFQDKRYRQAMSLAINREEINQFAFQGLAVPQQMTIDPGASFSEDWWRMSYAEYDPDKAKLMLDEVGLKDTNGDGWRERPDGEVFAFDMLVSESSVLGSMGYQISELVADYWRDIGCKVNLRSITQDLDEQRAFANEMDMTIFPSEGDLETRVYADVLFDNESYFGYAMLWEDWLNYQDWVEGGSAGDAPPEGEEPPQEIKDFVLLWDSWVNAMDKTEYERLGKQVWSHLAENVYMIGTVGKVVRPILINNRIHNVPTKLQFSFETYLWVPTTPSQWWVD